jgi:hypothetical protein
MVDALAAVIGAYRADRFAVTAAERAVLDVLEAVAMGELDVEAAYRRTASLVGTLRINDRGFYERVVSGLYDEAPELVDDPVLAGRCRTPLTGRAAGVSARAPSRRPSVRVALPRVHAADRARERQEGLPRALQAPVGLLGLVEPDERLEPRERGRGEHVADPGGLVAALLARGRLRHPHRLRPQGREAFVGPSDDLLEARQPM